MVYANAKIINFTTSDKLQLPGVLFEPKRKTKKALIYLHGNGSSSVFYSLDLLARQAAEFNKIGIGYLTFNNRGAHQYHKMYRAGKRGKEEKILVGTAYELIKDCVKDIDAAINFLKTQGYTEFYLIGFSTGANKICVYNYYKPKNVISKYILVCGGDDAGVYYKMLGKKKFNTLLSVCKQKIKSGKGTELAPEELVGGIYSYQSIFDTINPDGDYNTFPYNEYFNNLKLSKKKLFRHFAAIKKSTLVVYGDRDEYSYSPISKVVKVLEQSSSTPDKLGIQVIKDADHGFTGKESELVRSVVSWLS